MFDIDCFKRINDDFGHAEGDRVLKTVVALVGQRLRRLDALFRTGGEEFVLLLSGAGLTDAMSIAEEIRALVHDAGIGQARRLSISIGVAELSPEQSPEEWLVEADAALYRAKRDGRNRVAGWYGLPFREPDSQTAHPISFRVRMS
jgi:diguanylate cyclase (GGDEF)-like protein